MSPLYNTKDLLTTNAYNYNGEIFMADLSPDDIDKIAKKVFAKIAESTLSAGSDQPTPEPSCPEGLTFGCPNGTAFGCDIGSFVCKGKGFKCHPKYVGIVGFERV